MSTPAEFVSVTLETPLQRDAGPITELKLRRPKSGDLRGISLGKLAQLDYDEVRTLLPRITTPPLIAQEVDDIDPADMTEICGELSDFLFTKRRMAEFRNA